ncbi:MAG: hypothetical protein IPH20_17475 [Bacteroidales bacterium]|nr:hypothetical protein [Bacteroidales bacterium]
MESLKSEIKQLIDKLADRYNNLPDGALQAIDVDLMLATLRQLYEKTEALKHQPAPEIVVKAEPVQYNQPDPEQNASPVELPPEIPAPAPLYVPPVVAPQQTPVKPEITYPEQQQFTMPPVPDIPRVVTNEYKSEDEFARDSGVTHNQPLQGPLDLFGTLTIADKLKSDAPSLKDKIAFGKNDQSLAERMQLKSISDLKTAIGLNDKFQFINELFEGSADRYSEAVNMLNHCSTGSEAGQLFADLKSRYNWDEKNSVFMKLLDFVNRRYL